MTDERKEGRVALSITLPEEKAKALSKLAASKGMSDPEMAAHLVIVGVSGKSRKRGPWEDWMKRVLAAWKRQAGQPEFGTYPWDQAALLSASRYMSEDEMIWIVDNMKALDPLLAQRIESGDFPPLKEVFAQGNLARLLPKVIKRRSAESMRRCKSNVKSAWDVAAGHVLVNWVDGTQSTMSQAKWEELNND